MVRILVTDPIAEAGLQLLQACGQVDVRPGLDPGELVQVIGAYDALVVRSQTKVTAQVLEAGERLRVVGRAGVGVDNIDVETATRRGIVVVNAPTGNIVAAAEHTLGLLLTLARHIPQADRALRAGQWRREEFLGVQLAGKTLGILGLGKVGSHVAQGARGLEMRVLAYDPFVSREYAASLGVELVATKEELLRQAHFVTIHLPLTESTRNFLGAQELAMMRPGAFLINTARGGLVDEGALYEALQQGHLAGAALDVFSREPPRETPLVGHDRVIVTPHLGASTAEAQVEVAREVAEQVVAVLQEQPARYAVNAPFVPPETRGVLAPYVEVARVVGRLAIQLAEGQLSSIVLRLQGEIAGYDSALLQAAALTGVLSPVTEERINLVNARLVAQRRGLRLVEYKEPSAGGEFGSVLAVEVVTSFGSTLVAGTHIRGQPHIVRVNEYWMDVAVTGNYMLFTDHHDRPGVIGALGTITGRHDINISFMEVGRLARRGQAMMVVGLDEPVPDAVLEEIRAIPGLQTVKVVTL